MHVLNYWVTSLVPRPPRPAELAERGGMGTRLGGSK